MNSNDYLEERGREVLRKIETERAQFLVEIALNDEELEELFRCLAHAEYFASHPNRRACLALAAVHAANRADLDDTSYIQLFFRRLGITRGGAWEDEYGPAIARCLHEVFHEPLREGPFRFVGPIYRHAGVPRRALGSFAHLLEVLLADCGQVFTRHEYIEGCEGMTGGLVGDFLRSDAGYEFTRDAARVLEQIRDGAISNLDSVPGFPTSFWPDLLDRLQPRPAVRPPRTSCTAPQLGLNTETWRLGVRVTPAALKSGIRRDGRRLSSDWDPIRTGRETYDLGPLTWELPWSPIENCPAFFRVSDGTFVAKLGEGALPPGCYILVTHSSERPPDEIVQEDCGYLDWHGDEALLAWRVQLAPGYRNAIWNIAAAGDPLPVLTLDSGSQDAAFGRDVYLDRLPDLIVSNWNIDAERLLFICLDVGQGTQRLPSAGPEARIPLRVPCPAQGSIWLEPKGRLRFPAERLPRLTFTIIPSSIRMFGPRLAVREDLPCQVRAALPPGWGLAWDRSLERRGENCWIVPGGITILDGDLCHRGLSVRISWRVPRWSMRLRNARHTPHLLWAQDLDTCVAVTVEGPPGSYANLALLSPGREVPLWTVGTLPTSGACSVRALAFRDFLRASTIPAAELGLRLNDGPTASTGLYWIGTIERVLDAAEEPGWAPFIADIPKAGQCLMTLARLRRERQASCAFEFGLFATPIQGYVADCAVLAEAVDGSTVIPPTDLLRPHASEAILSLALWVMQAHAVLLGGGDAWACASAFPGGAEAVPFDRWRQAVGELRARITGWTDIPGMVSEWRAEVRTGALGNPTSRIARMRWGWDLTQGAVKYLHGVQSQHETQRTSWLSAAAAVLRQIPESAPAVVTALGKALWLMAIYRLGHEIEPRRYWQPPAWLRPAAETLVRVGMIERLNESGVWFDGMGFVEISPANEDAQLERKLGRTLAEMSRQASGDQNS